MSNGVERYGCGCVSNYIEDKDKIPEFSDNYDEGAFEKFEDGSLKLPTVYCFA